MERLYPHDEIVTPHLLALREALVQGAPDHVWLEEKLRGLLVRLLYAHREVFRDVEKVGAVRQRTKVEIYKRVHRAKDYMHVAGGALALGSALLPTDALAQGEKKTQAAQPAERKRPDPLDHEMVRKFVGISHSKLDEVKAMLEQEPKLVNATWDWGAGDWETALGAASHMGRRDIAEHLLSNGARKVSDCTHT